MELPGARRCTECGTGWSYFETGSPACPACGSLRSVSTDDEAALHTDGRDELDLTAARAALEDGSLEAAAERARSAARDYVRSRGFVRGGELADLDATYLTTAELAHVGDHVRRTVAPAEPTEAHFLALLAGDRPEQPPDAIRWARGLAAAEAVAAYRRDVARWLAGDAPATVRPLLDRLRAHERRIDALDGDVDPVAAEALVTAARSIGAFLREGDDADRERAAAALEQLG